MMFAWGPGQPQIDQSKRWKATEHQGERAICPLHGCDVESRLVNNIWQWVHLNNKRRLTSGESTSAESKKAETGIHSGNRTS
jgi:hypothetical protein